MKLPGKFKNITETKGEEAGIQILDGKTMVALTGVTYRWTLHLANPIPWKGKLYVTFPITWKLDCTNIPKIICQRGCTFSDDYVQCDPASNSLQYLNGFEPPFGFRYAGDVVIFDMLGMTNRPTTDTQSFTVTSYATNGNIFKIDESVDLYSLSYTTGLITI